MMVGRYVRVRLKKLGPVRAFIYTALLIVAAFALVMGVAIALILIFVP